MTIRWACPGCKEVTTVASVTGVTAVVACEGCGREYPAVQFMSEEQRRAVEDAELARSIYWMTF